MLLVTPPQAAAVTAWLPVTASPRPGPASVSGLAVQDTVHTASIGSAARDRPASSDRRMAVTACCSCSGLMCEWKRTPPGATQGDPSLLWVWNKSIRTRVGGQGLGFDGASGGSDAWVWPLQGRVGDCAEPLLLRCCINKTASAPLLTLPLPLPPLLVTPPLALPCVSPPWPCRQSVLPIVGCGVPPAALDREMDACERERCGCGGGNDTRLRALGLLRSSAAEGGHKELKVHADRRPLRLLLPCRFWDVVSGGQLLPVMRLAHGCGACGPCCSC